MSAYSHSVLLTTDGTYPCYRGGVSVWCDQLVHQMPDVQFHTLAITYSPGDQPCFRAPSNVASQTLLPLWGTTEPGPPSSGLKETWIRKLRTTPQRIARDWAPHFRTTLRCILGLDRPEVLAESLLAMHEFFARADFATTMLSEIAWEIFLEITIQEGLNFTLEEATKCMRWLQRYLAVTAVALPQTDLVHASMAGLAGIPGVLQKLRHGSGFVLTEHGIYLRELYLSLAQMRESQSCRRFLFGWFEAVVRMNYRYADCVTSLCEFNRSWQVRMGATPESIRIVPNGIDPQRFQPPHARPNADPVVLTMARIYRLKGIDHLLPAIRIVQDRLPNVRWRILGEVGDREYANSCFAMAEKLGLKNLEWGETREPHLAYQNADVFCLPSISEAMPYSVLEAMFSGCPVVATDVGGVAEMLAGTGLVVPPRDPNCLARALLSVLEGDTAATYRVGLAERALARARAHYDVRRCTELFRETYGYVSNLRRTSQMLAI